MRGSTMRRSTWLVVALLALPALALGARPHAGRAQDAGGGVETITGPVNGDIAQNPYGYMIMSELTAFVRRDPNLPFGPQVIIGWVDMANATYQIDLPIHPQGTLNQVGNGQGSGPGVAIYSIDATYDAVLDPRPSLWEFSGWSNGDSSMAIDVVSFEVKGGKIAVWAPDGGQFFPTGFGADGKLFTPDDPTGPVPAGWSVVDLDQRPFALDRSATATVPLVRNLLDPIDFSQLQPVEAFDSLIGLLRARWPLPTERPIDWDGLRATYLPEFEQAEQTGDPLDFNLALNHFLIGVNVRDNFANVPWTDGYRPQFAATTGLHVDETDDGRLIVVKVDAGLAAEAAGIQPGAEILNWNGLKGVDAVSALPQIVPSSTPQFERRDRVALFGRLPVGGTAEVTYRNPGSTADASATLAATQPPGEDLGRSVECFRAISECDYQTPLTVKRLPNDIWVIRVRMFGSDAQDVRLIGDAWNRAIGAIAGSGGKGIIVDVRRASPQLWYALPMYMAGSFFTETFPVAEVTSVDANGQNVQQPTYVVRPNPAAWAGPVAIVEDASCEGNCELFIQAMTHKPGLIIAGMEPTAGAVVTGYQTALLPSDCFVNFVSFALRDPETHQPIIEGSGFQPTLRVPRTPETLLAAVTGDPVMDAAAAALTAQIAAPAATATPTS